MQRHHPGANWFLDLLISKGNTYVQIYYPWGSPGYLCNDQPHDPYFENRNDIPFKDLQIGDGVIIDNHPAYPKLTRDIWRNENAVVIDIKGALNARNVWLQGHGTGARPLTVFLNAMIDKFNDHLAGAQRTVRNRPAGATQLTYDGITNNLRVRTGLPANDLASWAVTWTESPSTTYEAHTGIIKDGSTFYFPLWNRVGGSLRKVKASRNMLAAYQYFSSPGAHTSVVRPKIM
jgi:hypothetical protein